MTVITKNDDLPMACHLVTLNFYIDGNHFHGNTLCNFIDRELTQSEIIKNVHRKMFANNHKKITTFNINNIVINWKKTDIMNIPMDIKIRVLK